MIAGRQFDEEWKISNALPLFLRREDGRTIHLRKTTNAEPRQSVIYKALKISAQPGGVRKTLI